MGVLIVIIELLILWIIIVKSTQIKKTTGKEMNKIKKQNMDNVTLKIQRKQNEFFKQQLHGMWLAQISITLLIFLALLCLVGSWSLVSIKSYMTLFALWASLIFIRKLIMLFYIKQRNQLSAIYLKNNPDNPLHLYVYPPAIFVPFFKDMFLSTYLSGTCFSGACCC